MMILNLTRGKSSMCVPLRLPATPADIGAAYSKLDDISLEAMQIRIASRLRRASPLRQRCAQHRGLRGGSGRQGRMHPGVSARLSAVECP